MALLNNRLSLAIRFLTLVEFQVRRALDQNHEHPDGLFLENPKKTHRRTDLRTLVAGFFQNYFNHRDLP